MTSVPIVVDTLHGPVRGIAHTDGAQEFLGVPFAAAPVGDLRLRAPTDPQRWDGVYDATAYRAVPLQDRSPVFGAGLADPAASDTESDEDCLYLNVWTASAPGPKPVIVWLFGGGFDIGGASPPFTDGAALARGTGAVVVAANYRLGALGFLHLADLGGAQWAGSTNLGLQDQIAALKWVGAHIAQFGGDPENITVAGESAGAYSIGALLGMPAAGGLFAKAIVHSGTTRAVESSAATAMLEHLLTELRLSHVDDLIDVPARRIVEAQSVVIDGDLGRRTLPGGKSWGPVVDGALLPCHPFDSIAAGAATQVPLLIGANLDEVKLFEVLQGDAFKPADIDALTAEMSYFGVADPVALVQAYRNRLHVTGEGSLTAVRTAFLTDAVYRFPATRLADSHTRAGGRAYRYLFSAQPFGATMGAFHAVDLAYLFDKLSTPALDTAENRSAQHALYTAWSRFAATGDPGWPPYRTAEVNNVRQIGAEPSSCDDPPQDEAGSLWRSKLAGSADSAEVH